MAAAYLETPSRVWRRIEAVEGRDMPSLPSLPTFDDDSAEQLSDNDSDILGGLEAREEENRLAAELRDSGGFDISGPAHSTPAASTIRPTSSTNSTARFANSIASRSARSSMGGSGASKSGLGSLSGSGGSSRRSMGLRGVNTVRGTAGSAGFGVGEMSLDSFDASVITSLPVVDVEVVTETATDDGDEKSVSKASAQEESISVPDVYLPPEEEEEPVLSFRDALASVHNSRDVTPKKYLEYSVDLKSEAKPSPKDRFRNVAIRERKTITTRTRTPSLSRTTPSPVSSPTNSTPRSNRTLNLTLPRSAAASPVAPSPIPGAHIPLPRSATASPAIVVQNAEDDLTESIFSEQEPSLGDVIHDLEDSMEMDETEIHGPSLASSQGIPEHMRAVRSTPTSSHKEEHSEHSETDGPNGHEPTFSSEEGPSPHASHDFDQAHRHPPGRSPSPVTTQSSTHSAALTPTSVLPRSRPRARFAEDEHLDEEGTDPGISQQFQEAEDPITPNTRRRSFLLAVINSNTRPRLKQPTPHPRRQSFLPSTPSIAESTPAAARIESSDDTQAISAGPALQTAFAGVTPRPRAAGRGSHPLAQAFTVSASSPSNESREGSLSPRPSSEAGDNAYLGALPPWATPGPSGSPYDGASDRASVISTASSHDLTTHHRANTSFDPVLGLGAQGHGLGRFNAGKLNTYLHSLNRRLQEENEALMERVKQLEEDGKLNHGLSVEDGTQRRLSTGSRRVSLAGTVLGNVEEDVNAEGWMEEKAQLEEMLDDLQVKLDKCAKEKVEVEKALECEQSERARDKDRWKERMGEVEKGVEEIVRDLERRLENASKEAKESEESSMRRVKEVEHRLSEVEVERDAALERVGHAERALESGKDLGGELASANERISVLTADLRNANIHIRGLEDDAADADAKISGLEMELQEERETSTAFEQELRAKDEEISGQFATLEKQAAEIQRLQGELLDSKEYIVQLEEDSATASDQIESLERQLSATGSSHADLENALEDSRKELDSLQDEIHRANELARQMEEALEAAEQEIVSNEGEVTELKAKISTLEREKEREALLAAKEPSKSYHFLPADPDVEVLEAELDDAHKEIARLMTVLSQSPARKAVEKAREVKLETLEKENEELKERVKALRSTMQDFNTPSRIANASGVSPFHRQALAMSIRNPRTPGGPLRDMSWLNNSPADSSASPYLVEISRLQKELNMANESIDDKLDKLEDVGFDIVGLTKMLEDARGKISNLEDEIARLLRREERRTHRLERLRCKKCLVKVELKPSPTTDDSSYLEESYSGLPSEPPTPPTKTTEALRAKVRTVNESLTSMQRQWTDEKQHLLGEKAMLQDATNRLNIELRNAREETKRVAEAGKTKDKAQVDVQQELENARMTIAGLENDLRSERARIRALGTEQSRVQHEKEDVLAQIQRTESDMSDVKAQLLKLRKENHDLEGELRGKPLRHPCENLAYYLRLDNAVVDQKARLLEARLAETASTMEQLRQERSLLAADHKDLQKRYSEVSEQASRLREEYAATQTSHDNHRQQLDLRQAEIDELRQALSDQADELRKAEAEKDRLALEKKDVARTISVLEGDLKRVRKEAEALGRDLKLLKADKERLEARRKEDVAKAERAQKQSQSQIRLLNEQLQTQKDRMIRIQGQVKSHVCAADDHQLQEMRLQHKDECKGLLVNIRYLQAKLTREGVFRLDLSHQKRYLLVLLAQFEKSEQTIIAAISKIGYPLPFPNTPSRKLPKLKSIALCAVFSCRAKRASEKWKEHTTSKAAVVSALHEVRRRRATTVVS